jgi:hypothetical protein
VTIRFLAFVVLACVWTLLAGCGGSGRLSRDDYRAQLAKIGREADQAHGDLDKVRSASSVTEIRARVTAFADASGRLGDEVASLKPPRDAEAANAELARGEHDTASAIRSDVLPSVAKAKSVDAVAKLFQTEPPAVAKASGELDQALGRLRKLGYTKGS